MLLRRSLMVLFLGLSGTLAQAKDIALIGNKGSALKKIGTEARKDLESLLGTKVFLGLYVKVAQDWRDNPQRVRELDWHFQLEGLSAVQAHEPGNEEETEE